MMANAEQPTSRTRHLCIKLFALQDWVKRDLMIFRRIASSDNFADPMTKSTGRTLHYRHFDYVMGRIQPSYVRTSSNVGASAPEEGVRGSGTHTK